MRNVEARPVTETGGDDPRDELAHLVAERIYLLRQLRDSETERTRLASQLARLDGTIQACVERCHRIKARKTASLDDALEQLIDEHEHEL